MKISVPSFKTFYTLNGTPKIVDLNAIAARAAQEIQQEEDTNIFNILNGCAGMPSQIIGKFKHPYHNNYFFELSLIPDYDYQNPNIPIRFKLTKLQKRLKFPHDAWENDYIVELSEEETITSRTGHIIEYQSEILKKCKRALKAYSRKKL